MATSALIVSKRQEIALRLRSLDEEFSYWTERSKPNGPLEKHHTQIRGITRQLTGLRDRLSASIGGSSSGTTALVLGQQVERDVLELFRIWEYFRSKLAQRESTRLRPYLDVADELAWACYAPIRDAALKAETITAKKLREPPLVFLNGCTSPFAAPRYSAYDAEVPGEALQRDAFRRVLQSLPIPVVGVPWFQVSHLPDALVIAHEIGHHIEDDFGLTATLGKRLKTRIKDSARRAAWLHWLGEAFADILGAVALGGAFARTMMDLLAALPSDVVAEVPGASAQDTYPSIYLRILLVLEVVKRTVGEAAAKPLHDLWNETYGTKHSLQPYEKDVTAVVDAFAFVPFDQFGKKTLSELLPYTQQTDTTARQLAAAAAATPRRPLGTGEVRIVMAAARYAFDDELKGLPANAVPTGAAIDRLRTHLIAKRAVGVRSRAGSGAVQQKIIDDADRTRGASLVDLFAQLRASPT